jgi:hypothetical protein
MTQVSKGSSTSQKLALRNALRACAGQFSTLRIFGLEVSSRISFCYPSLTLKSHFLLERSGLSLDDSNGGLQWKRLLSVLAQKNFSVRNYPAGIDIPQNMKAANGEPAKSRGVTGINMKARKLLLDACEGYGSGNGREVEGLKFVRERECEC